MFFIFFPSISLKVAFLHPHLTKCINIYKMIQFLALQLCLGNAYKHATFSKNNNQAVVCQVNGPLMVRSLNGTSRVIDKNTFGCHCNKDSLLMVHPSMNLLICSTYRAMNLSIRIMETTPKVKFVTEKSWSLEKHIPQNLTQNNVQFQMITQMIIGDNLVVVVTYEKFKDLRAVHLLMHISYSSFTSSELNSFLFSLKEPSIYCFMNKDELYCGDKYANYARIGAINTTQVQNQDFSKLELDRKIYKPENESFDYIINQKVASYSKYFTNCLQIQTKKNVRQSSLLAFISQTDGSIEYYLDYCRDITLYDKYEDTLLLATNNTIDIILDNYIYDSIGTQHISNLLKGKRIDQLYFWGTDRLVLIIDEAINWLYICEDTSTDQFYLFPNPTCQTLEPARPSTPQDPEDEGLPSPEDENSPTIPTSEFTSSTSPSVAGSNTSTQSSSLKSPNIPSSPEANTTIPSVNPTNTDTQTSINTPIVYTEEELAESSVIMEQLKMTNETYADISITEINRQLFNLDQGNPSITIKLNKPLNMDEYQYVLNHINVTSSEDVQFRFRPINSSNGISAVEVEVLSNSIYRLDVVVHTTIPRKTHQGKLVKKTETVTFEPALNLTEFSSKEEYKTMTNIRDVGKGLDNQYINSLGYIGFLSLIMNSPQEIVQLQFLNYTIPINLYQFETMLSRWVFDNKVPDWEEFPPIVQVELLSIDISEHVIDQNLDLERYTRITFLNCFLYNNHKHLLLTLSSFILFKLISLIKRRRVPIHVVDAMISYDIGIEGKENQSALLEFKSIRQELVEKLDKENSVAQIANFIMMQMFLEGKLCIYLNSLIISFYQPNIQGMFSIVSLIVAVLFLLALIVSYLRQYNGLRKDQILRQNLVTLCQNNIREQTILEEYLWYYDQYLRNEYSHFLDNRRLTDDQQLYSVYIGLIKKIIYVMILVLLYDRVVIQIFLLLILHTFATIYKFVSMPYRLKYMSIITGFGDVCFVVVLGLKYNDYLNLQQLLSSTDTAEIWFRDGWITMIFEIVFLLCYNLVFWGDLIIKCKSKKPHFFDKKNQRQKESTNQQPTANNIKNKDKCFEIQGFSTLIEDKQFIYKISNDLNQQEGFNNIQNDSQDWDYSIQSTNRDNCQTNPQLGLSFYELNAQGYFERESGLFRERAITLPNNMQMSYKFTRYTCSPIGDRVKRDSKFLQGQYVLAFEENEIQSIHSVNVGVSQPYQEDMKFYFIDPNPEGIYVWTLRFDYLLQELSYRQFQVKVEYLNQESGFIENYTILLSGSELLLFEPVDQISEVQIANLTLLESIRARLLEGFLMQFLEENKALNFNASAQVHRVRMNYPIVSSITINYRKLLIQFKRTRQDQYTIDVFCLQSESILPEDDTEMIRHYIETMLRVLSPQF